MIGARVDVRTGWGEEFAHEVNQQVGVDVAVASQHGADVAAAVAARRHRSGKMEDIRPVDVRGTQDGWEGGFRSAAFYSGMQSRGTVAGRKRKLKASTVARRGSGSGQARFAKVAGSKGVTPLGHEEAGLKSAKKQLVELLNRI